MIDPQIVTAGGVDVIRVVANSGEGGYSVAVLRKDGEEYVGFRWNGERDGKGYPTARGYPVWCALPREIGILLSAHFKAVQVAAESRERMSDFD
ncbi:MAG TPA: hypothetical protein VGD66_04440 [Allosphingosinicella sp.]|jgi:hypothetical protein